MLLRTSKARNQVGLLFWQFYRCADTDIIHMWYITIVRPHLEYACQVWDPYLLKDQEVSKICVPGVPQTLEFKLLDYAWGPQYSHHGCVQETAEIVHFVQLSAWVVRCSYRNPLTQGTTCFIQACSLSHFVLPQAAAGLQTMLTLQPPTIIGDFLPPRSWLSSKIWVHAGVFLFLATFMVNPRYNIKNK